MAGLTLPPEQRSIMPGVNALQDRERLLARRAPYVDSSLVEELMGGMPLMAGVLHKGGKYFHGTPYVFDKAEKSKSGLAGPGHYITDNAEVASDYAHGSTFRDPSNFKNKGEDALLETQNRQIQMEQSWKDRIAKLLSEGRVDEAAEATNTFKVIQKDVLQNLGPNTRPYQVKPHQTFTMDAQVPREDMQRLFETAKKRGDDSEMLVDPKYFETGVGDFQGPMGKDIMYGLQTALSPNLDGRFIAGGSINEQSAVNKFLQDAGFGSIQMEGGVRMGAPGMSHDALNILDMSLLEPYFDYASKKVTEY